MGEKGKSVSIQSDILPTANLDFCLKTTFDVTQSKEILYFKCIAQPQIIKRFLYCCIMFVLSGVTAVAKQQVIVIIANEPFVTKKRFLR